MMRLVSAGACAANEAKTWSRKLRNAGKVAMDADLAVVEYLQGNNKKFAVFARLHAFGDLDVFNIVVQTLEDGD